MTAGEFMGWEVRYAEGGGDGWASAARCWPWLAGRGVYSGLIINFSSASAPVIPGLMPMAAARRVVARMVAVSNCSGVRSGCSGVPLAMATARLNSSAQARS